MPREFKMGPATRESYGEMLLVLGAENPNIVVLDADLSKSTYTGKFGEKFPDRFFNVGIAEANMASIAAGLAYDGKIPFLSSFVCFGLCKGFDQLRAGVAYPRANVKCAFTHGGISIGEDGPSQQSVEDFALATALPGFVVLHPADDVSAKALVREAAAHPGPVFLRLGRPKTPILYAPGTEFPIGRAKVIQKGKDVTIVAIGLLVSEALKAADILKAEGVEAGVIDLYCLKPVDEAALAAAAAESGAIVTAEEHLIWGGLSSIVARVVSERRPVPIRSVSLGDTYAESATGPELFKKYGLTAEAIVKAAKEAVAAKRG
ncbi:MAG: transketolase C-terminal domain-containing protein [Planctomycetota bacterium]